VSVGGRKREKGREEESRRPKGGLAAARFRAEKRSSTQTHVAAVRLRLVLIPLARVSTQRSFGGYEHHEKRGEETKSLRNGRTRQSVGPSSFENATRSKRETLFKSRFSKPNEARPRSGVRSTQPFKFQSKQDGHSFD